MAESPKQSLVLTVLMSRADKLNDRNFFEKAIHSVFKRNRFLPIPRLIHLIFKTTCVLNFALISASISLQL